MRSSHTFPLAANLAAVHLAVADLDIELVVLLIWTPPNALFLLRIFFTRPTYVRLWSTTLKRYYSYRPISFDGKGWPNRPRKS